MAIEDCTLTNLTFYLARRFGAQILTILTAQQVAHWAIGSLTDWSVRLGPYALIASGFVSFFKDIPMLQKFKIIGIPVTDKACACLIHVHFCTHLHELLLCFPEWAVC